MTTPDERTGNLLQVGASLKEPCEGKHLPEEIQEEARRLLRHYPTAFEVKMLAEVEMRSIGSHYLTPNFDKNWFGSYRFGSRTR